MKKQLQQGIVIRLTANDLFYLWLQGIKSQLKIILIDVKDKEVKKDLKKVIKLLD